MKINRAEQRLLIALTAIITGAMILYTACRKPFNPDIDSSSLIGKAKNWFTNDVVKKERDMLEKPDSILGLYVRRFARMQKLSSLLNWNEAKEYNEDGIHFVISLVNQARKPFKNQNFEAARAIIFYLDRSGRMKMNIMEILGNKGGSLGSDLQQIARFAFVNKQVKKNDRMEGLNATIIFYEENYRQDGSFQIKNGSWSPAKVELKNRATVKERPLGTRAQRTTCQTCTHWYLVGFWYDTQTLEVLSYEILDEWDECTENGPPTDPGYGESPSPPVEEDCNISTQQALNDLSNATVSNETQSISTIDETPVTRTKKYEWVILRGVGWYLFSFERGVHVKTNNTNPSLQWKWQSLEHQGIARVGVVIGGSAEYGLISATPTLGLYNAIMDIDFKVTYAVFCKGSPFSTELVYHSANAFNVND
jgi:hypothetical protein